MARFVMNAYTVMCVGAVTASYLYHRWRNGYYSCSFYSIYKYVTMIENAFSLASALQFMLSAMVLCLVGVQFLSIENPSSHCMQIMWMAVYLTCMLTEVFILCWFGNQLIIKSLELQNAAFASPWLGTDSTDKLFIIILMERSKRPLQVTAGKIFTLSLDAYTNLINWSYKAFAVMRNMKNNVVIFDE
ncbi:unnamed protein product [Parnassius apollo]|uniref:(apollo) hypothetical protein n=1 Tax=Parnassius apollo TaxID=110799 RepID=A0A8S3WKK3_PARAO|nr:unnamed protein product [Parnassius apollo]